MVELALPEGREQRAKDNAEGAEGAEVSQRRKVDDSGCVCRGPRSPRDRGGEDYVHTEGSFAQTLRMTCCAG